MKKIKILYLIDKMALAGAQKHLTELAIHLDNTRFEPTILTLEELGVRRIYGISGIKGIFKLARKLREEKFDIVQTYLFSENILGVLAARIAGVKTIMTGRRDTGMLMHGNWRHIMAYKLTNRWVDKIVCVSEAVKKVMLEKEKVNPEKVTVVYNGVDVDKFSCQASAISSQLKEKLGIKEGEFVVGMIANFSWIKGHKDLIAAIPLVLKEMPNAKFLLIGEGPLRADIENAIHNTQDAIRNKVLFLGSRQDIPQLNQLRELI